MGQNWVITGVCDLQFKKVSAQIMQIARSDARYAYQAAQISCLHQGWKFCRIHVGSGSTVRERLFDWRGCEWKETAPHVFTIVRPPMGKGIT